MTLDMTAASTESSILPLTRLKVIDLTELISMDEIAEEIISIAVPTRKSIFLLSTTRPVRTPVAFGSIIPTSVARNVKIIKRATSLLWRHPAM